MVFREKHRRGLWIAVFLMPVGFFFLSLVIGRYPVSPPTVIKLLAAELLNFDTDISEMVRTVLFRVRIPRVISAMLIGGALSVSGAAFQGLFRNPLVSPYILGVASGAGFGASLAILFVENAFVIQLSAFFFGTLAVVMSYGMTRLYRTASSLVLVLSGIIVGTFFTALISLIKFWADPFEKLPLIVFWLMGSLAAVTRKDMMMIVVPMVIGLPTLYMIRWKINVLSLGEEEARALGVETGRLKILIILSATLITASAVAISGIIGWVGLVIPHLARMMCGPDYRVLIPVSFIIGACYLVFIDDIARNLTAAEVPLGILTATIGAPVFAWVLRKSALGWT
jgi:iron complex transport system permease protein